MISWTFLDSKPGRKIRKGFDQQQLNAICLYNISCFVLQNDTWASELLIKAGFLPLVIITFFSPHLFKGFYFIYFFYFGVVRNVFKVNSFTLIANGTNKKNLENWQYYGYNARKEIS